MKDYKRIGVDLPQYPQIARVISPDEKRIYINRVADHDAKIDYLMAPGQRGIVMGPGHPLPEGKEV